MRKLKILGTSLYIAISNKICIADMKTNYARLQTIAHECVHSVQDRRLLICNFIFSNIVIISFIIFTILGLFNIIQNIAFACVYAIMLFFQYVIRSYLEIDAMTRARYIVKDYIDNKKLITSKEAETLLTGYEQINKVGIPFVLDNLFTSALIKLIIIVIVL